MEPSRQVVMQRIRNRIIEYLEMASSFEAQRSYEAAAQRSVPYEVINQWEDWVTDPHDRTFTLPVFSEEERAAIVAFHRVWEGVVRERPDPLPTLERLFVDPAWERLREAAAKSLGVFMIRGTLPEDDEFDRLR